jgi:hypothetical protein
VGLCNKLAHQASAITSKPTTYDHFERVQTLPPRAG